MHFSQSWRLKTSRSRCQPVRCWWGQSSWFIDCHQLPCIKTWWRETEAASSLLSLFILIQSWGPYHHNPLPSKVPISKYYCIRDWVQPRTVGGKGLNHLVQSFHLFPRPLKSTSHCVSSVWPVSMFISYKVARLIL